MSARKHERTRDRAHAVQVLYTSEIQGKPASQLLESGQCLIEDGPLTDYALGLVRGVEDRLGDIDARLAAASENWALSRMPIVDRSILRLATYEMFHVDDVPVSVSINEAVELAKDFGGEEDSPRFVNGVLGRIARQMGEEPAVSEASSEPADAIVGASGAAAVVQVGV